MNVGDSADTRISVVFYDFFQSKTPPTEWLLVQIPHCSVIIQHFGHLDHQNRVRQHSNTHIGNTCLRATNQLFICLSYDRQNSKNMDIVEALLSRERTDWLKCCVFRQVSATTGWCVCSSLSCKCASSPKRRSTKLLYVWFGLHGLLGANKVHVSNADFLMWQ